MDKNTLRIQLAAERERATTAAIVAMTPAMLALVAKCPAQAQEITAGLTELKKANTMKAHLEQIDELIALVEGR